MLRVLLLGRHVPRTNPWHVCHAVDSKTQGCMHASNLLVGNFMQCPQLMLEGSVAVLFPCFRPVLQVDSIDNGTLVRRGASEVWEPDDIGSALTALGQSSSNSSSRSSTDSKSPVQRATDKWLKVVGNDFSLPLDQHEAYRVSGEWTKHPVHGWQIR
jgi:hypothetical protein